MASITEHDEIAAGNMSADFNTFINGVELAIPLRINSFEFSCRPSSVTKIRTVEVFDTSTENGSPQDRYPFAATGVWLPMDASTPPSFGWETGNPLLRINLPGSAKRMSVSFISISDGEREFYVIGERDVLLETRKLHREAAPFNVDTLVFQASHYEGRLIKAVGISGSKDTIVCRIQAQR